MPITDYHSKYFAHELTKRCSSASLEKLAGAVAGAQVDLNPHQVDTALFAFSSPLSKGALLADEVGLGKTIEAGLVLSQKWAERKRRILIIVPSNLRKQWHQELSEKFFLPCRILEAKPYNAAVKQGNFRPFECDEIVICSYQFARNKAADVANTPWDLVVMDEAHRLRNVYKPSNVIANTLKLALANKNKLLLTATPLQNSLLELFGLVSFIDEHTFGDLKSFREQYTNLDQQQIFDTLKTRLKPICHRTLRRQVTAYTRLRQEDIQRTISERNASFFEAESEKLEGWADDLKLGLEREIKDIDRQIKDARRAAIAALTLEDKLAGQKQIKSLEQKRSEKRRSLFEAQDKVDQQRESLISAIEGKLVQNSTRTSLFTVRWKLN